jgi:hypothetical protein
MWECYNCAFQNVDTSPVCSRCRARKPAPGEKIKGRSYHAQQELAKERAAEDLREQSIPTQPPVSVLRKKWQEDVTDLQANWIELAKLEQREHALREALKLLIGVIKNPQIRNKDDIIANAAQVLLDWDADE